MSCSEPASRSCPDLALVRSLRPWIWLLAPLAVIALILVYPLIATIVYAFHDARGERSVGWANIAWAFGDSMRSVLSTNIIWLIVFPVATLALAVVVAVLFDRVRYEELALTLILLPTAIAVAAGSNIWR